MKAIKAIYENGKVKLTEKPAERGPVEVMVVFPEPADEPWHAILEDPSPRPELTKWIEEVKREIMQGKAKPLELNDL